MRIGHNVAQLVAAGIVMYLLMAAGVVITGFYAVPYIIHAWTGEVYSGVWGVLGLGLLTCINRGAFFVVGAIFLITGLCDVVGLI